jgi:hypothetical protein
MRYDMSTGAHTIYVDPAAGGKGREATLGVLRYVHAQLPTLKRMGLQIRVVRIRAGDLENPQLLAALRRRGVVRLPALATPKGVYLGHQEISSLYGENIKEFLKGAQSASEGSDLDSYYRDEMTLERAREDSGGGEEEIGEGGGMMGSYRQMMERRGTGRPGHNRAGALDSAPPAGRPAGGGSRPDNVATPPGDDLAAIARIAPAVGPALLHEESMEDGESPQDDLMERAYWGRMSETED